MIVIPVYIYQYIKFIYQLILFRPDIVSLNPSLCYDSVIRDGIYLLISKAFNKKVIIFWHGWKTDFEEKIEKKYLKLFKGVFNQCEGFIVLSSHVKKKLIHWGFSQPMFSTTTKVDNFLIQKFNVNDKVITNNMLFLGRLEKNKGIFETLRTFQLCQKNRPSITLTYAGNGPDEESLKEIIEKENIRNVSFVGFVKNQKKINILLNADIFILPSYTEGMPTTVLEAMAFGIPIITRPVGGIPDFFIDSKMGFLIESKNPNDFAAKIEFLYSDKTKWNEISKYNHNYALAHFMASEIAEQMISFYKTINR